MWGGGNVPDPNTVQGLWWGEQLAFTSYSIWLCPALSWGRSRVWAGVSRDAAFGVLPPDSPASKLVPDGAARTLTLDLSSPGPES